ncbi:ABC transporter permease [Ilumatobacter nonamiensis]|uniref:ABC transporter permease n=1 Tax=Ilumatobacter nonamiensis TaxID=467093 RepID=UPI00034A4B01|nr:ABC transporter permease [Ilumatobacter nonamiensis]
MVLIIFLVVLVALIAWVIKTAGWKFAAQRFGGAIIVLILVTFGTSLLLRQVPGEPCEIALGTAASEEAVAECVDEQGLDDNVVVQYVGWSKDTLSGDFGYAFYKNKEPLIDTIEQRMPRTAFLFLYSQLLALLIAVPLGIWAAYQAGKKRRNIPSWLIYPIVGTLFVFGQFVAGWRVSALVAVAFVIPLLIFNFMRAGPSGDTTVNFFAFVLLSIPVFVIGESLRYAFSVERDWYQLTGYAPWSDGVLEHFKSIWLPAVVLGLAATPVYLRLLRADILQNLQQDYVSVAKAKGMSNTHILMRHVLRPSTLTLMTVLGLNIAQLVNGAVVVEFIFDFDGMGGYLIEAVYRQEFFAVQTIVALVAALFILTNLIIDLLYTSVDPRVKASTGT